MGAGRYGKDEFRGQVDYLPGSGGHEVLSGKFMIIIRNIADYIIYSEDAISNALRKIEKNNSGLVFLVNIVLNSVVPAQITVIHSAYSELGGGVRD